MDDSDRLGLYLDKVQQGRIKLDHIECIARQRKTDIKPTDLEFESTYKR